MKIFKNRGDIYISKSGYKSSKEERILLSLLAFIVVFTVALIVILSQKYSSPAEFFVDGEDVSVAEQDNDENELPSISGKINFLILECSDDNSELHYMVLVQADADSLAYKVSSLSPNMKLNSKSVADIYAESGGAGVQNKLTEFLGFNIDYYAQFNKSDFVEYVNKMGDFIYPVGSTIRFDGGSEDDEFSIRLKEGENKLDGRKLSGLMRYYINEKNDFENANIVSLYALTGLFNEENFEKSEQLFRIFIQNSTTNVTVRDFENSKNILEVFSKKNKDITIYSAVVEYENNELTKEAVQNIKGYFSK